MDEGTVVNPPERVERIKEEIRGLRRSIVALHREWHRICWWRGFQIRAAVLGFEIRHRLPKGNGNENSDR